MDKQKNKKDHKEGNLEINKMKEELEKIKREKDDYKNKYLRALADYQNYEKRVSEEKEQIGQLVIINVLLKLLPFLDNLNKAEIFIKDQGLNIIKDKFHETVKELGVEEIDILGKQFDPHLAEAIEVVGGKEDNKVIEILRKGYKYRDKVIRVAQVKVTKKNPKS